MNDRDLLPSVWRYGLALVIVIAGFAAFVGFLYSGISNTVGGLEQMAAPGEAQMYLKEPGEYTIFYENKSYFNGSFYMTADQWPGLQITVLEKASGRTLQIYPAPASSTYSLGERSGQSIMAFRAKEEGIHLINASYPSDSGPKVILAVGKGIMEDLLSMIGISLVFLLGSLLIAAYIVYTTYTRRKKIMLLRGGIQEQDSDRLGLEK